MCVCVRTEEDDACVCVCVRGEGEEQSLCVREGDEPVCVRERGRESCAAIRSCAGLFNWILFFIKGVDYYQPRYESVCNTVCLSSVCLSTSLFHLQAC